jgi:hypothetical protein
MTKFSLVESFRSVYFTPSSTVRQYFLLNVGTLLPDDTVYNIIGQQSTVTAVRSSNVATYVMNTTEYSPS